MNENANVVEYTKHGKTWSVNVTDLPAKAIEYLLRYGWTQSHLDSAAMTRDQKVKVLVKAGWAEITAKDAIAAAVMPDNAKAVIQAAEIAAIDERHTDILAGVVGTGAGGPRLDPLARAMRDVVEERIDAFTRSKGLALMKGDQRKLMVEKALSEGTKAFAAFHGETVRAEAEWRLKGVAKATSDEVASVDELLA